MKQLEAMLTRTLEVCLALALLTIAVVVVLQVVLSFVFNSSITGANELVTKLFVYTSTIGAALAIGRGEHIRIGFATDALPLHWQQRVGRVVLFLVGLLNLTMLAYSFRWIRMTGDYVMPTTQLPRWVVQLSVPMGCGLALIFCGLRILRRLGAQEQNASSPAP